MRGPSIATAKGRGVATTLFAGGAASCGPGPSVVGGEGPRAASTSQSTQSMLPGARGAGATANGDGEFRALQVQGPEGSRRQRSLGWRSSPRPSSACQCAGGRQRRVSIGTEPSPCSRCLGGIRGALPQS
jgi:hypothetical protein